MRIAGEACFQVDANLRPEGRQGALVRTLDGHVAYYKRWAKTWEFQALLKARPVAGDPELGKAYAEAVAPMVWSGRGPARLRRRRAGHAPPRRGARAPGPRRPRAQARAAAGCATSSSPCSCSSSCTGAPTRRCARRRRSTRWRALSDGGYVGRDDGANLAASYRFLRLLEHRLQLQRMRRTHLLPAEDDTDALRWLARAAKLRPDGRHDVVGVLHGGVAAQRPAGPPAAREAVLPAAARRGVAGVADTARLSAEAATARLGALGWASPEGALQPPARAHRRGVAGRGDPADAAAGAARRARPQPRTPTAACWPTAGCPRRSPAPPGTCGCCATRGWSRERLMRLLGHVRAGPGPARARAGGAAAARRAGAGPRRRADPRPGERRRDRCAPPSAASPTRTAAAATARSAAPPRAAPRSRARTCSACWTSSRCARRSRRSGSRCCRARWPRCSARWAAPAPPARLAVIGMGRLGGGELGYGSDADVLFVCEPLDGATDHEAVQATRRSVAETVRRRLGCAEPGPGAGRRRRPAPRGPLRAARAHAGVLPGVLRALVGGLGGAGAAAGPPGRGRRRRSGARFIELVDPIRYPTDGLDPATVTEIRRIKARVDAERLPRGADRTTHTKLGHGGLADVEWTVQLLQLQHAGDLPELRTTSHARRPARGGARRACSPHEDAEELTAGWTMATRARNAVMLVRGKPGDQLPRSGRELAAVAAALGYPADGDPGVFLDDYRRATRRARASWSGCSTAGRPYRRGSQPRSSRPDGRLLRRRAARVRPVREPPSALPAAVWITRPIARDPRARPNRYDERRRGG